MAQRQLTVKQMHTQVGWNINLLLQVLPASIVSSLLPIHLPSFTTQPDTLIWKHDKRGCFSMQSWAHLLNVNSAMQWDFQFIWKLKLPPRVILLMWKLGHGKLLTNVVRLKWGVSSHDRCPLCFSASETLLHLFRDCPFATEIWRQLPIPHSAQFSSGNSFAGWLKANLQVPHDIAIALPWYLIFAVTISKIWMWRCSIVFQNMESIPRNPVSDILLSCNYWLSATPLARPQTQQHFRRLAHWVKPPDSVVKVNVDGSCTQSHSISTGGLLRDAEGNWILGFTSNMGHGDSLLAELWAIWHGAYVASQQHFRKVIIETDSLESVSLIQKYGISAHPYAMLIMDIKAMMPSFAQVSIQHTYRQANAATHRLALLGQYECWGLKIITVKPDALCTILLNDVSHAGVADTTM